MISSVIFCCWVGLLFDLRCESGDRSEFRIIKIIKMKNLTFALVAISKTTSLIIGVLASGYFLSSSANAATFIEGSPGDFLTGIDKEIFSSYNATLNIDLGSGIGSLVTGLDPDLESFFEFNYDAGTVISEYNLLATVNGSSDSLAIAIQESGNILSAIKIGDETSGDRI